MLLVAFLYVCFAVNVFVESLIMSGNPYPLMIAGIRICGAGLILLAAYVVQHGSFSLKKIEPLMTRAYLKYVIVLYVLSVIAGAWSMQYIDPVTTCFIFVLSPFMTAVMLYFWYGEKLTKKKILGLCIGFMAVVPIILASTPAQQTHVSWAFSMLAYSVFTSGILLFAYGWILHKDVIKNIKVPAMLYSAISLTLGGAINLFLAFLFYSYQIGSIEVSSDFWWQIIAFTGLTALSYSLYSIALKHYSVTFVSFASFTEPAYGMLFALLFLGKSVSCSSCIALVALAFGLYIFYQEELRSS